MTIYEYPLNEQVRILLRLEYLADQFLQLTASDLPTAHHFATRTLFEIADLCDARSDLKSDILKDLERYRQTVQGYSQTPGLEERVADLLAEIDHSYRQYNSQIGKLSAEFNSNEWLTSVRSRISIPAGACSFDHPSYHAWQHASSRERQADLQQWFRPLEPSLNAARLLLRFLRDSGQPNKVLAEQGMYQLNLPPNKTYQLVRVGMDANMQLIPETSGNRLMLTIRLKRREGNKLLLAGNVQASFELTLCA